MSIIIGDCCANHMGQREMMELMIKKAAEIGIDYVKFQAFQADKLNPKWENYKENYEYYKKHELSIGDCAFILKKCEDYNIKPLFTVFDLETVDFLLELDVESVKIASPDANNWELIHKVVENFDDVIISTGMHNAQQIRDLKRFIRHKPHVRTLYCISKYPTEYKDVDFDEMLNFDGFSDHTKTLDASKKALDLGMDIIERHYTLGKDLPGRDHLLSSTPEEFKELVAHRNYLEKCEAYKTRWQG